MPSVPKNMLMAIVLLLIVSFIILAAYTQTGPAAAPEGGCDFYCQIGKIAG